MTLDFREYLVFDFGGCALAILDGTIGSIMGWHYPLDFVWWAPGWILMIIGNLAMLRVSKGKRE